MSSSKLHLISMVRNGGKGQELSNAEAEKKDKLQKHLQFEEDLLRVKESTLNGVANTITVYSSLIIDSGMLIKQNRANMFSLLKAAKKNADLLKSMKSKKGLIKAAMIIGSNKSQVEILKNKNIVLEADIVNYTNMRNSAEREEKLLTAEVEKIKKSIATKQKALGIIGDDEE